MVAPEDSAGPPAQRPDANPRPRRTRRQRPQRWGPSSTTDERSGYVGVLKAATSLEPPGLIAVISSIVPYLRRVGVAYGLRGSGCEDICDADSFILTLLSRLPLAANTSVVATPDHQKAAKPASGRHRRPPSSQPRTPRRSSENRLRRAPAETHR